MGSTGGGNTGTLGGRGAVMGQWEGRRAVLGAVLGAVEGSAGAGGAVWGSGEGWGAVGALESSEGTRGQCWGSGGPARQWGSTGGEELKPWGHWGRRCSSRGAPWVPGGRRAVLGGTPVLPRCRGRKSRGDDGVGTQRHGDRPCKGEPQPWERGECPPKRGTITPPVGQLGGL